MTPAKALVVKHVVKAGFQTTKSPHIKANAQFQPKTAYGKLKAVITPTIPSGFHYSIITCSGLSLGITFPDIVLLERRINVRFSW